MSLHRAEQHRSVVRAACVERELLPPVDIAAWRDTVRRDVPPDHTMRLAFTVVGHCVVMMRRRVR
jgi:hypothetical protein